MANSLGTVFDVPDYEIPEGSLPQTSMQEEISMAYVHMVTSAAGLTLLDWKTDYGAVDVTVKSLADYGCNGGFQPQFDLQLKATTQDLGQNPAFSWPVDRRTHLKLANPNRASLAVFAVLQLPREPQLWLNHNTHGLLARSHMYWIRGSAFPPISDEAQSVTLHINKQDRFDATQALLLMKEASERWL